MDIQHGHAPCTYTMEMQHVHRAWICSVDMHHRQAVWTCSRDMQHRNASRTCSKEIQHEHASWTRSTDMKHGHRAWGYESWTCSLVRQPGMLQKHAAWSCNMDMNGNAAWICMGMSHRLAARTCSKSMSKEHSLWTCRDMHH
jgi:hypothetical protein